MGKNQKRIFFIIFFLFLTFILQFNFEASSGKLKSASICTADNGLTYGHHGDGHWHRAEKRSSGWYPQGANLGYSNPCESTNARIRTFNSDVEPPKPKNEVPKIDVQTTSLDKFYFELKKEVTSDELIRLFNVVATDKEDGELLSKVEVNQDKIIVDNHDKTYEIVFKVTDSQGQTAEKTVMLHVKKRDAPVINEQTVKTYKKAPQCDEILQTQQIVIRDNDGNNLEITCDNITIDEANNLIIVHASDQFGLGNEFKIDYKIAPKQASNSEPNNIFGSFIVIGASIYGYKLWRKKRKVRDL